MCYVYAYDTHKGKYYTLSALEKLVPGWISNFGEVSSSTDLRTHPWLTLMAIKLYEESNPAIPLNDKVQIIMGSIEEDYDIKGTSTIEKYSDITPLINLDFYDEINYKVISNRCVNHFMGPGNMPLDNIIGNGDKSALDWAKDEPSNLKNFSVAIGDKDLRALGHALHLLQDMSVPAHVRNDSHAEKLNDIEKYEYYLAELTPKDYNNLILPPSLNNIVANNIVALFTDLSAHTRDNYFSDDTIFSNHYRGMPLPIAKISDVSREESNYYFYNTTNTNRKIAYKSVLYWVTYKSGQDPQAKLLRDTNPEILRKYCKINDEVVEDSFKDLGSKAIGYSAKLIKLYYDQVGVQQIANSMGFVNNKSLSYVTVFPSPYENRAQRNYNYSIESVESIQGFSDTNKDTSTSYWKITCVYSNGTARAFLKISGTEGNLVEVVRVESPALIDANVAYVAKNPIKFVDLNDDVGTSKNFSGTTTVFFNSYPLWIADLLHDIKIDVVQKNLSVSLPNGKSYTGAILVTIKSFTKRYYSVDLYFVKGIGLIKGKYNKFNYNGTFYLNN